MRLRVACLVVLALAAPALADDIIVVYGETSALLAAPTVPFCAGGVCDGALAAAVGADGVHVARLAFEVDDCHRRLVGDVVAQPDALVVDTEDVWLRVPYQYRLDVWAGAEHVAEVHVVGARYSIPLGTMEEGPHVVELRLAFGALSEIELFRVRGWALEDDPACAGTLG